MMSLLFYWMLAAAELLIWPRILQDGLCFGNGSICNEAASASSLNPGRVIDKPSFFIGKIHESFTGKAHV